MGKLLLRADDLGYSEGTNLGILKSIKDGLIRNVGFMINMPSTNHGFEQIKGLEICLGLHVNICAGKPITKPELIPSLVNTSGFFKSSKEYRTTSVDFVNLDEVILEIEAQYQRFKAIVGEEPRYFEGHAVASENFLKGLEIVAKRHNLKYIPFNMTNEFIKVGNTKVYITMESMKPDYDPFTSLTKLVENIHEDGCDVFVCHPGYLDGFIIKNSSLLWPRALEVDMLCAEETKEFIKKSQVKLVTYDDL